MAWSGGTADGAVWGGEEQGLRGDCGCHGGGNGGSDTGGAAGNADGRAAAGLVAERCGEAEAAGLGEEAKVWQAREAVSYLPPGACWRKI